MKTIMKISLLFTIIIPHVTSPMFLRVMRQKKYARPCSTYQYQTMQEKLKKSTRMHHFDALQIAERNKKLQEKLNAQNSILEEFRKDKESNNWWISEAYAKKIYWAEKELQMVANEKY